MFLSKKLEGLSYVFSLCFGWKKLKRFSICFVLNKLKGFSICFGLKNWRYFLYVLDLVVRGLGVRVKGLGGLGLNT